MSEMLPCKIHILKTAMNTNSEIQILNGLFYIGQTGCRIKIRYNETRLVYNNINIINSVYAQHVRNKCHTFGNTDDIKDLIYITRQGKYLDTMEQYYIYLETF
jgi:hypothetical protein